MSPPSLVAEEQQLLAEKRWIIDALHQIKQQRNSLQIERLHLESLEAEYKAKFLEERKQAEKDTMKGGVPTQRSGASSRIDFEDELVDNTVEIDFDQPANNDEVLNLSVSRSVFNQYHRETPVMEEFDEEDDEILNNTEMQETDNKKS